MKSKEWIRARATAERTARWLMVGGAWMALAVASCESNGAADLPAGPGAGEAGEASGQGGAPQGGAGMAGGPVEGGGAHSGAGDGLGPFTAAAY